MLDIVHKERMRPKVVQRHVSACDRKFYNHTNFVTKVAQR